MISSVNTATSPSVWQTLASNGAASTQNPFAATLNAAQSSPASTASAPATAAAPAPASPGSVIANATGAAHHGHGHHHHAAGGASGSTATSTLLSALTNPTYSANGSSQTSPTQAPTSTTSVVLMA